LRLVPSVAKYSFPPTHTWHTGTTWGRPERSAVATRHTRSRSNKRTKSFLSRTQTVRFVRLGSNPSPCRTLDRVRAFVTGATGFVGSHLAERLLAAGWAVRGLVRPGREAALPAGVEPVRGTLDDLPALRQGCAGCEVVFHVAAELDGDAPRERVLHVNVGGTENVLRAAEEAGVRRFLFTSSVAVYGESAPEAAGEDTPLRPTGVYGESKVLAEDLSFSHHARGLVEVVVLRPCFVYGPRDRRFTRTLVRVLRGGWFPVVAGGSAPLDVVHVADVVEAHLLAAVSPQAAGRAYNVTDGARRTIRELLRIASRALGVRVREIPVPAWAVGPAAVTLRGLAQLFRVPGAHLLSPGNLRAMLAPHHFSIARARAELDYAPRYQAETSLPDVLARLS
jgi:dihydroflavonol-4-reductase